MFVFVILYWSDIGNNLLIFFLLSSVVAGASCVTSVTIVTIIISVTCVIIVTSVISGSRYESIGSCVRAVLAVLLEYWY